MLTDGLGARRLSVVQQFTEIQGYWVVTGRSNLRTDEDSDFASVTFDSSKGQ